MKNAVTGTDYYYTTNGGMTYTKAANIAYADFATNAEIGTGYTDATWQAKGTGVTTPVNGTAYYLRENTGTSDEPVYTYTYCVILPQQTDAPQLLVYKPGKYWECKKGDKAVKGMLYYDMYTKNDGERYAKVIKVQ